MEGTNAKEWSTPVLEAFLGYGHTDLFLKKKTKVNIKKDNYQRSGDSRTSKELRSYKSYEDYVLM